MTSDEFLSAIIALWPRHGSQTRAAEYLGVQSSRVREWLRGARPIPDGVAVDLRDLLARFPGGVVEVNPRESIAQLQRQMVSAGWAADLAAAGILGAAWGNARIAMGDDAARALIMGRDAE